MSKLLVAGGQSQLLGRKATAAGNGLLANLIGYWALDEAAGANNALDKHTGGLTLTQHNSPDADTGKAYATARTFGGTQYFSRADEALLRLNAQDWTIAAWIKPTIDGAYHYFVSKHEAYNSSLRDYSIYIAADGKVVASVVDTAGTSQNVTGNNAGVLTSGNWYFVITQNDATNKIVSVSVNNGTPDTQGYSVATRYTSAAFSIGAPAAGDRFPYKGSIGPVAMWKSAAGGGGLLSAAKITALYNGGNGLAYASFTA